MRAVDWTFVALVAFIALSTIGPVDNSDRLRELLFWGALGVVFHVVAAHLHDRHALRLLFVALVMATLVEASVALFEYVDRWSERSARLGGAIVFPLPEGTLGHAERARPVLGPGCSRRPCLLAGRARSTPVARVRRGRRRLARPRRDVLARLVDRLRRRYVRVPARAKDARPDVGCRRSCRHRCCRARALGCGRDRSACLLAVQRRGPRAVRLPSRARRARCSNRGRPSTDRSRRLRGGGCLRWSARPRDPPPQPVSSGSPSSSESLPRSRLPGSSCSRSARRGEGIAHGLDEQRLTALGFVAVLVAFLVNGLLEYPLWSPPLTTLVALLLAVAVALDRQAPNKRGSPGTPHPNRSRFCGLRLTTASWMSLQASVVRRRRDALAVNGGTDLEQFSCSPSKLYTTVS